MAGDISFGWTRHAPAAHRVGSRMVACLASAWTLATALATDRVPPSHGEALARQHCAACHLFPEPDLLDRRTWEQHTLRKMAPYLGVARVRTEGRPDGPRIQESGIFPPGPVVTADEWRAIAHYYASHAPEEALGADVPRPQATPSTRFAARILTIPGTSPRATLASLGARPGEAWLGDAGTGGMHRFDATGRPMGSWKVGGAAVHVARHADAFLVTLVGSVFPSDVPLGRVAQLGRDGSTTPLLEALERPVMTLPCDVNGDGQTDLVVNGFGNQLGRLAWHEGARDGGWRAHEVLGRPGAVCTEARDVDGDGDTDLLVLMAQGQEQLLWLENQGGGELVPHVLLAFHPAFGAVHFESADLDGDGDQDVVLSNGDNGEYPSPFKRYHGVRLFRNDGGMRLVEAAFLPVHGAFKALARDLDLDGDADLSVISFFPDYRRAPEESFLVLRNDGGWRFGRETIPEATSGRWLTMDAGDVDGDGDVDVLLGSFCEGPPAVEIPAVLATSWRTNGVNGLLLINQARR